MTTVALSALRSSVRLIGDYQNSAKFTDAFLLEWINQAVQEYHEFLADSYEGYLDKLDETIVTVAGTQLVALPSDFLRLRKLERKVSTDYYTDLERVTLANASRYGGRGEPRGYSLHGPASLTANQVPGRIRIWPVPDGVYTIRATYIPVVTPLAIDADSIAFLPGGDKFVIYSALVQLDEREGRDIRNRIAQVEAAKIRIKASAKQRDTGEPEYLTPRGSYGDEEY